MSSDEGGLQEGAVRSTCEAGGEEQALTGDEPQQLTLAEWKSQQVKKKAQSTRERLRDEYARQAAQLQLGDRCEIGGYKGEIAFLGDRIDGLPGGFWVGIRYDEPVGKNDGTVKGKRLFHCHPNCGHLLRPDKVLEGTAVYKHVGSTSSRGPAADAPKEGSKPQPNCSSSDEELPAARPNSMTVPSPSRLSCATTSDPMPRARSFSPVRHVVVSKREDPVSNASKRYEKWQSMDPAAVIGTDPVLDETLPRHRTGLVYDRRMEAHCSPGDFHPEQPLRITAIFAALADQGLAQKCWRVPARNATQAELVTVHTAQHVQNICNLASKSQGDLNDMAANLDSVYLCPESGNAALLASGSVVEATRLVCKGKIARACCVVRPPGHHALPSCAMGFCLFGNVAVAAKEARKRGWAQRVLIFDWDVHHGNGTQKMFWEDDSVLCFSVHRFDKGNFYPGGPNGGNDFVGAGDGRGYNVNVPWPKSGAGDKEYKAVVDQLLRPIASEYKPDLVLISAGFDAAQGDPLGGCQITPDGYYMMTKACKELAGGKVVLALEGGYSLRATAQSMASCVAALLDASSDTKPKSGDDNPPASAPTTPPPSADCVYLAAIEETRKIHAHFWKNVRPLDDTLDDERFRAPAPATPASLGSRANRECRSEAARGSGGWQVRREASSIFSTPTAPVFSESKSVGGTPITSGSTRWQGNHSTPPVSSAAGPVSSGSKSPVFTPPGQSDSSCASTEASSRESSSPRTGISSPAPGAMLATQGLSVSGSGLRNSGMGRTNSRASMGSRSSVGSVRSWPGWDDDSD